MAKPNQRELRKRFNELINWKDDVFVEKHLRLSGTAKEFYYSNYVIWWTEELYYLFKKIEKKNELIFQIIDLLSLARIRATPKVVKELEDKLSVF